MKKHLFHVVLCAFVSMLNYAVSYLPSIRLI
jgi:hypothetical protein